MKSYDVIVIGAGDVGLGIVFKAVAQGLKVALVEKGPVGGTCLNYGGVPSKTLIYTADRIREIREATKAIVKKGTEGILGFHIIGPQAALLIQEVVNSVNSKKDVKSITAGMHIFPPRSNLIPETLGNLE